MSILLMKRITGYSAAEAIGRNCRFLQAGDRDQPELEQVRAAIREAREFHVRLRNYRKDGTPFWNELNISPVRNGQGHLTHFVGIQTDITDRQEASEALRKSSEQLRLIFEMAPIGMAIATPDGKFVRVNQALCDTLGYNAEELLTRSWIDITPIRRSRHQQSHDPKVVAWSYTPFSNRKALPY